MTVKFPDSDVEEDLRSINKQDLYDFLELDRSTAREKLLEKANQVHQKEIRVSRTDRRSLAKKELAQACLDIFSEEKSKKEYDHTLAEAPARDMPDDGAVVRRSFADLWPSGRGVSLLFAIGLVLLLAGLLVSSPNAPAGSESSERVAEADRMEAAAPSTRPVGGTDGVEDAAQSSAEDPLRLDRSARRGIQDRLKAAGFYTGAIDGLFGPGTRRAIRNWQTTRGSEATGYLDEEQAGELMALAEPAGGAARPRSAASATAADDGRSMVQAESGGRVDLDGGGPGSTDARGMALVKEVDSSGERASPEKTAGDSAGEPASPGGVLVSLASARSQFDAGDYEAAADVARALLQVQVDDDGPAHLLLGRALYALGRFEDSIEPLRRAIARGERVELDARHRHGVGEFRQGFCRGVLTFERGKVTYRSEEEGSHDFVTSADRITDVEIVESIDGQPFRLTSRVQDGGSQRRRVDFMHRNVVRQLRSGSSRFSAILVCGDCDGSLGVQAALMGLGGG